MGWWSAECTTTARLDGKTAVITGANTGIGKCTAQDFYTRDKANARIHDRPSALKVDISVQTEENPSDLSDNELKGARVVVACRNLEKANEAIADVKEACKGLENLGTIVVVELDLSSLASIRNCAKQLLKNEKRIDLLINNAGVMMCVESRTKEGFEMQIGTNHLGHFLLTMLLLPKIRQSTPARIVNVSSAAHTGARIDLEDLNWEKKKYGPYAAYQQSKLANILFTNELARRLKESGITGVTTYSLHPGAINTELTRHLPESSKMMEWLIWTLSWAFKTPIQGSQTTIFCAVDDKSADESGLYYAECAVASPNKAATNMEDARALWDLSWKLVRLDKNYDPFINSTKL